jgi:hypothetical protein
VINPIQIKQKAEQRYSSFLVSIITGESFFPMEVPVGALPKDYLALREAVTQLIDQSKQHLGYGYTLELKTRRMQKHGTQSLPKRISIETELDYLKLIKKAKEVVQFKLDIELIRSKVPELKNWLFHHHLKVIEYSDRWNDLLKVCQYFQHNPKPNLYIRELPIQVHTKFIEQNQKIIRSLLETILEQLVSVEGEKEYTFEKRFSLKYREPLIRLRLLDQTLKARSGFAAADISIPMSEFRQLNLETHRCFITENLMNFLTLPLLENSFALFGSGYAVQTLKSATWLSYCPIFYWGDLDVDGFKILSQLRSYFPQTISIMMDLKTFETFYQFSVPVAEALAPTLPHLTPEEETLYTHLALHQKRLEQERISQNYVNQILHNLMQPSL